MVSLFNWLFIIITFLLHLKGFLVIDYFTVQLQNTCHTICMHSEKLCDYRLITEYRTYCSVISFSLNIDRHAAELLMLLA